MSVGVNSIVEVSGEHPNLPIAEVLASLRGLHQDVQKVWYEPRFLALQSDVEIQDLVARLAFGRFAGKVLLWGPLEEIRKQIPSLDFQGKRLRLRVADRRDGTAGSLEAELGGELASTGLVDLETPDVDLRLVRGRRSALYAVSGQVDRSDFEARAARNRPFTRPFVLHPRFARALVNLTGVAPGETLLDPFCGTGGILMEASLVGAHPVGADLRGEVIEGCRRNLAHFGMKADLHVSDAGKVAEEVDGADAIATDPPYGRGATTGGEDPTDLLARSFATFAGLLDHGGRLAMPLPAPELIDLGRRHFELLEWHRVRVHRSLDRYFCVFQRP